MKRVALALALLAATPAAAASWVNVDPYIGAGGNPSQYRFAAADGTGLSSIRALGGECRTVAVGFADGAGGDADVYSCSDEACTESKLEASFTADGELVFVPRFRSLRVDRVAVGAGTSVLSITCGANVARASAAGSGYATVQDEGTPVAQETVLDCQGAGITCTAGAGKTVVTVPGGGGGSTPTGTGFRFVTGGVEDAAAKVQNAGTDVTADLEEETHAAEHQNGGADPVATATPGANVIPQAGAGGALADGFVDGAAEAGEVVGTETDEALCSWESTSSLVECDLAVNAGTALANDLEEETHASEHNEGGADALSAEALASSCASGETLEGNGAGGVVCGTDDGGAGSGDSVTVNGSAQTDVDLDDATPAAPTNTKAVHWQASGSGPANVSGHVYASDTTYAVVSDSPSASQNDYSPTGWNGTQPSQATVLLLTPTVTLQITGVAGGAAGRMLTLINATDPAGSGARLIVLPNQSASSSAANRFTFSNRQAWFLLPGDSMQFIYDGTASRWRPLDRATYAQLFDAVYEFNGAVGGEITSVASGTGASTQVGTYLATSATQNPGAATQADTGTVATGRAGFAMGGAAVGINPEEGAAFSLTRIAVEALAVAAGDDFEVLSGFSDGIATQPLNTTDGAYWLYDVDASASWQGCSEDTGTKNCATTGSTVDTNYIYLGVFMNGDWSRTDYLYSTDGVSWTIGTAETTDSNIPDTGEATNWVPLVIVKEAGTTQRNADIDFAGLWFAAIRGS